MRQKNRSKYGTKRAERVTIQAFSGAILILFGGGKLLQTFEFPVIIALSLSILFPAIWTPIMVVRDFNRFINDVQTQNTKKLEDARTLLYRKATAVLIYTAVVAPLLLFLSLLFFNEYFVIVAIVTLLPCFYLMNTWRMAFQNIVTIVSKNHNVTIPNTTIWMLFGLNVWVFYSILESLEISTQQRI